jgi:hypothetical protein
VANICESLLLYSAICCYVCTCFTEPLPHSAAATGGLATYSPDISLWFCNRGNLEINLSEDSEDRHTNKSNQSLKNLAYFGDTLGRFNLTGEYVQTVSDYYAFIRTETDAKSLSSQLIVVSGRDGVWSLSQNCVVK